MQSKMQGHSGQGQGQVREHVIHQQSAPHQHATMNGFASGQSGQLSVDTSQRMLQAGGVGRSPSSAGRYVIVMVTIILEFAMLNEKLVNKRCVN